MKLFTFLATLVFVIPPCIGAVWADGLSMKFVVLEPQAEELADWPTRVVDRNRLHSREYWDDNGENDYIQPIHYWYGPVHGSYCRALQLTGRLAAGDAARLERFLKVIVERSDEQEPLKKGPVQQCFRSISRVARSDPNPIDLLILNFSGGNLAEALKIVGALPPVTTVVPRGARCVSACALVFLSGRYLIDNEGSSPSNHAVSRWMHVDSDVGFHAPQPNFDQVNQTRTDDLNSLYRFTFDQALTLSHLLTNDLDESVIARVMDAREANDFAMIDTTEEAWRYNIDLYGYRRNVGRNAVGEIDPPKALVVCGNVWERHTKALETAFPEINAGFVNFEESTLKRLENNEDVPDLDRESVENAYYFKRNVDSVIVFENYAHARYSEARRCSVSSVGRPGLPANHFLVSIEGFRSTESQIVIPAWYAYEANLPLRITEYEK